MDEEAGAAGHPVPAVAAAGAAEESVKRASYSAKAGNSVEIADLERYFAVNGYQPRLDRLGAGEFAIRGGVIDVFPPAPRSRCAWTCSATRWRASAPSIPRPSARPSS
jgi:transcription-repair coupling factor (superfamily II helicase)